MRLIKWLTLPVLLSTSTLVLGQANLPVYTDRMVNMFQDYSWAPHNSANTSPVHSGSDSISVTVNGTWQALSLYHPNFNVSPYASLSFWAHGGTSGGQKLQVYISYGASGAGTTVAVPALTAGTWTQFTLTLSSLGVANRTDVNRINIQHTPNGTSGTFYIDDIQINAAPAPALVHLNVNTAQALRTADSRWFGVNTAMWDSYFDSSDTINGLKEIGTKILRCPGGSASDEYNWSTDKSLSNPWTWATSFGNFVHVATNVGVQAMITVNYGTGSSNQAAAWVAYANGSSTNTLSLGTDQYGNNWQTVGYWASLRAAAPLGSDDGRNFLRISRQAPFGFKYWEIGNECYGTWETDSNSVQHDPYTYATRAARYATLMKAVDNTIKIGAVAVTGEDSSSNNANHAVINSRTGLTHYGWTPVMLTYLRSNNVTPDFLIHHVYPQWAGPESDALLMQSTVNWAIDATDLRQQLQDYLGTQNTNVELLCTENNNQTSPLGRQSTSIVDALYLADSVCQIMKTEFNGYFWWDLRNGSDSSGSFDPTIYGWRLNGDEGLLLNSNTRYPMFYTDKLLQYFIQAGDTVLNPTSDYLLLADYAARRTDGSLTMLVINRDVTNSFTAQINLTGFVPGSIATVRAFGILQDEATRTNNPIPGTKDISTNTMAVATSFTNTFPMGTATLITFSPGIATTLGLTSSANPATYGTAVTLTATVRTNGVTVGNISGETVAFYDGATQLGTGTLNSSGQASYTTTATQLSAVVHSLTARYAGDATYITSSSSPALSQTVSQATVTAGLTGTVIKNYNGTPAASLAPANYTLSGVASGDTVALNNPASGSYDDRNQGTGKTVTVTGLAISGASATNYLLSNTSASGSLGIINKTNITITAAANSKPYDSTTNAAAIPAVTSGSIQSGDTGSFTESYATKNPGTGLTLVPAGSINDANGGNNYNLTLANNTSGVIIARSLTVTATGVDKPYDGTAAATVTLSDNRVAGDVFTDSYISASFNNRNVGTAKTVNVSGISISGTDAGNYGLANTTASTTATIGAQAITVTAAADTKVYDGAISAAATPSTLGTIQSGDTNSFAETYDTKDAGSNKTLTPSGSVNDGNGGNNYTYIFIPSTNGTINTLPAQLAGSRRGDGTTTVAAAILSVANKVGGDDVTVASGSGTLASADEGLQPITSFGDLALGGASADNYTLAGAAGSVNIIVGNATVTVTNLFAMDKVYDTTTNALLNATNASLVGVLDGESVMLVSSNASGYFTDKNVGTNKPVFVIGFALEGADATNYVLATPTNVIASIMPVGLTIGGVMAADKVYDGTTIALLTGTPALGGVLSNDDVTLQATNVTASFIDATVGTNKPVTAAGYDVTGADADNYTVAQPVGLTAAILPLTTPTFAGGAISKGPGGWQLSFSGQSGQNYKLLVTGDLKLPLSQWAVVASGTFGPDPITFTDSATNFASRFYIIVSP